MSEEQKQEAAEHARKASRQAKHAAKNGIRAVQKGTGATVKLVGEEAEQFAEHLADEARKAEGTAEDAVRSVKGSDVRLAAAVTAMFLGGTYLVGRIAGARQARRMTPHEVMNVVVKSDTPLGADD